MKSGIFYQCNNCNWWPFLSHMINFIPPESDTCEDQNGIDFKLIGASMAKLWLFFYSLVKKWWQEWKNYWFGCFFSSSMLDSNFASGTNQMEIYWWAIIYTKFLCRLNIVYTNTVYKEACVSEPVFWLLQRNSCFQRFFSTSTLVGYVHQWHHLKGNLKVINNNSVGLTMHIPARFIKRYVYLGQLSGPCRLKG